jgi:hypothetical protein
VLFQSITHELEEFVNQSSTVMKPEFPRIDRDKTVSPHAQEVECALILSQMINTVKEDPSQMRLAIYEFARARLQIDMSWADEEERRRLSAALETAIQGVEGFSARQDERERLQSPIAPAQIGLGVSPVEQPFSSMVAIDQIESAPKGVSVPKEVHFWPEAPIVQLQRQLPALRLARFWIGVLIFGVVASLVIYNQRTALLRQGTNLSIVGGKPVPLSPVPPPAQQTPVAASSALPFPLPSDYGVYALSNAALSELHLLVEQVPDKRVAMSTPISQPSSTTLPDGKPKFVVFRRDLAGNAPDRMDVRVVARVVRALTFDARGKVSFSPVSDAWNIRNLSYVFRVRPIAGNPEMLLAQAENADFALPSGRYVLVLKNQGYDFTVAGKITDPSQCLERTDAANGEFYSDCGKH